MALSSGDIIRFGLVSVTDLGVQMVNNLHYRLEGDSAFVGNEPTAADAASEVWTKLGTAYRALLGTNVTVQLVHAYQEVETWNGEIPSAGDFAVGSLGTAIISAGQVPRPVAISIALKSDVASRSARGWILVPGPINAGYYDANGRLGIASTWGVAATAFAALLDDNIQHDVLGVHAWHLQPVIYSRTRRKRGQSPYYFSVKQAIVKTDPRWVKRRRTSP